MIRRGEIYFISLDPVQGRETAGRRPVLVVSSNAINRQPLVVSVIVGTDSRNVPRDYPTNVRMTAAETGLSRDTVFLAFQTRALDPSRFVDPKTELAVPAGVAPPARMAEVERALRLVFDL